MIWKVELKVWSEEETLQFVCVSATGGISVMYEGTMCMAIHGIAIKNNL